MRPRLGRPRPRPPMAARRQSSALARPACAAALASPSGFRVWVAPACLHRRATGRAGTLHVSADLKVSCRVRRAEPACRTTMPWIKGEALAKVRGLPANTSKRRSTTRRVSYHTPPRLLYSCTHSIVAVVFLLVFKVATALGGFSRRLYELRYEISKIRARYTRRGMSRATRELLGRRASDATCGRHASSVPSCPPRAYFPSPVPPAPHYTLRILPLCWSLCSLSVNCNTVAACF